LIEAAAGFKGSSLTSRSLMRPEVCWRGDVHAAFGGIHDDLLLYLFDA